MKTWKTVIFDLDGTLLNTLDDLTNAVNCAMRTFGYPQHTLQEVRSFIGGGIASLIRQSIPAEADDAAHARTLDFFREYYTAHNNDLTAPYEGVCALLERLKQAGVRMAVVSNKNDQNVRELCDAHFSGWIDVAVGEQAGVKRKPAPDSLLRVMEKFDCTPEETLYVGDSDVDVYTAANAGVDCAAVLWGFRSEENLRRAGAKRLFADASALGDYILGKKTEEENA